MIGKVAASYRRAFSGLPKPVWILAFVAFVNRSGTMVVPFLVLYLTEARGYSATAAGRLLALYGLGAILGTFLGGWLSDRVGTRRVLITSLWSGAGAFLLLGFLQERWAIACAIFFLSLVSEAFRPALATAMAEAAPAGERGRAFALNRLAVNLGMSFGPAAGGFLALINYFWLFIVDGVTSFLAGLVLIQAFRRLPARAAAHPRKPVAGDSPWSDRPFVALVFLMTLYGLIFFQLLGAFPLTLRDRFGLSESWIGISLAVNTVVITLFEMLIVHALRHRDPYRIIGFGSFLMGLGFALLPFGTGRAFVIFTVLIWTMGEMLSLAIVSGVVAERAGDSNQGRFMGAFALSFAIAFVAAPLLGTWVYQNYGPQILWPACGLLGLLLWIGFSLLSRVAVRQPLPQTDPERTSPSSAV